MATIIGLLLALIRLAEHVAAYRQARNEVKRDGQAILTLRRYKIRLEMALEARREARLDHHPSSGDKSASDGVPDDGFRRD